MTAFGAVIVLSHPAMAGTTGTLSGHVLDSLSQTPVQAVSVTAASPSQTETTTTDASGAYSFASLAPDTYTVTASKTGYETASQPGISVLADQTQTYTIVLKKTATVLGTVRVVGTQTGLVHGGVSSDVYSITGATAQAANALGGSGNLNNAYSQMAAVPGVNSVQGQQGWYQPIYIRGGDLDQVGWEFDGIPVNRTYDNAPQTFLSNLGQQQLEVYTGGTSANADASGISGYVNQVIERGTAPDSQTLDLGAGGPAQYNKIGLELSGATPNNKFSYYVGSSVVDQGYRYIDNFNGASYINQGYFYPINTTYFGAPTNEFTTGNAYGIADTQDHENVANFHLKVGASDDLQLLYTTSYLYMDYYSSQNDLGGTSFLTQDGAAVNFADQDVYAGPLFQAPNPADVVPYLFPSTPHAFGALIPPNMRDTNTNSDSISKLQYQHDFSPSSYLRVFG
ncbi:MAG TPA: TonB-dependent receptor, partial [Candidatus Eremiobacteraceae bacterium]|nr:TonB-dependent receptor [Candidatus Eremiobacteraceae bacterium]